MVVVRADGDSMNVKEAAALGVEKERRCILKFLSTRVDSYDDRYGEQQMIIDGVMEDLKSGLHIYILTDRAKGRLRERRRLRARVTGVVHLLRPGQAELTSQCNLLSRPGTMRFRAYFTSDPALVTCKQCRRSKKCKAK